MNQLNRKERIVSALQESAQPCDLLIAGGHLIDPGQGISAVRDIAIVGQKIARVASNIPRANARRFVDASGLVVTPGLIDAHVHVYDGVTPLGIPADPACIAKGVTTALDAGSAGAYTFPGFLERVVKVADTRIFALLNISVIGQSSFSLDSPYGELLELRYANPRAAIRVMESHRDVILGVKVRLSRAIAGENDLEALALAKEASGAVGLPLMVHIGGTHSPLPLILERLERGDVVTHTFHGNTGGILDEDGRVLTGVLAAASRGVHFDVGHGVGSFSFAVAESALQQGILPGTISSDVHRWNVDGPVFDLATTLSKFLCLGLSLEQVIERVTTNAANAFRLPEGLGTLSEGSNADVAVFALEEGDFEFSDAPATRGGAVRRIGHQKLVPRVSVKSGQIYGEGPASGR